MANSPGALLERREIRHFHLFCGLGGGARGFNRGSARVGNMVADFRCIGGIDVDAASIRDFGRLAGVPGTVLDLFDREQFEAFHGRTPPSGWREAAPADIHAAAGHERPHIVFLSAPCKGFSGLLSETKSQSSKYQALNKLTLRGIFLVLEAYEDDLPELILFENVPRIANRGRKLLDQSPACCAPTATSSPRPRTTAGGWGVLRSHASASSWWHGIGRRCLPSSTSRRSARCAPWATCSAACRCRVTCVQDRCTGCRASTGRPGSGWPSWKQGPTGDRCPSWRSTTVFCATSACSRTRSGGAACSASVGGGIPPSPLRDARRPPTAPTAWPTRGGRRPRSGATVSSMGSTAGRIPATA